MLREFQVNFDLAALSKPFQIRTKTRGKSNFIEQGWVQQMRNGPQVSRDSCCTELRLSLTALAALGQVSVSRLDQRQVHA